MVKLRSRVSFSISSAMFILLLSFAPSALGQGAGSDSTRSNDIVLSQPYPGVLLLDPTAYKRNSDRDNDNDGCDARGRNSRGKCTAVPEGGTAVAYLTLVALGCLAILIFKSRRQASS